MMSGAQAHEYQLSNVQRSRRSSKIREVLKDNIFDLRDLMDIIQPRITQARIRVNDRFPLKSAHLRRQCSIIRGKSVAETHLFCYGMPYIDDPAEKLTIARWNQHNEQKGLPTLWVHPNDASHPKFLETHPAINEDSLELRWYAVFRGVLPHSRYLSPSDQLAMIPKGYEPISPIAAFTANMYAFLKARKQGLKPKVLHENSWTNCTGGICVGGLFNNTIDISPRFDEASEFIGQGVMLPL